MARTKSNGAAAQSIANIGFVPKLWLTADKRHAASELILNV
jgi:hypothetical protein